MSRSNRWPLTLIAVLALATPAAAQQIPTADPAGAPMTSAMRAMAPVVSLEPATPFESVAVTGTATALLATPAPAMRRSQSVALMIVGGAGMIVGSLIDGDSGTIIMVGGGVLGLVGLFQYLR